MCQDSYPTEPTAHLCSYDELVRALGRGAVGDSAAYSGDWTWTVSVGHDRSPIESLNTLSENTAWSLLTGSCSIAAGSRLKVEFGFAPADNDFETGTNIEIESTSSCGSVYKLLCCL